MKTIGLLLISLSIFTSITSIEAKGVCDTCWDESCAYYEYCKKLYSYKPFAYSPIKVGSVLNCNDGLFGIDLTFKKVNGSSSYRHANYEVAVHGVYGPRLSGSYFETLLGATLLPTRLGNDLVIKGELPELDGELYLTRRNVDFQYEREIKGHVLINKSQTSKKFNMECDFY